MRRFLVIVVALAGIGCIDPAEPLPASGATDFIAISAGTNHTCALNKAGQAFCWGSGNSGALGDGTRDNHSVPVAVHARLPFTQISAGNYFTCALDLMGA